MTSIVPAITRKRDGNGKKPSGRGYVSSVDFGKFREFCEVEIAKPPA